MSAILGFLSLGLRAVEPHIIRFGNPEVAIAIETGYGNNYGMDY